MLSLIAKRGLTKAIARPNTLRMAQRINNVNFVDVQSRQFAKKKNNKKDYSPVLMKPCKKVLGNKSNN